MSKDIKVDSLNQWILVQNATILKDDTPYIGRPTYRKHGASPTKLQSHGDKSEPINYRNIWLRKL